MIKCLLLKSYHTIIEFNVKEVVKRLHNGKEDFDNQREFLLDERRHILQSYSLSKHTRVKRSLKEKGNIKKWENTRMNDKNKGNMEKDQRQYRKKCNGQVQT